MKSHYWVLLGIILVGLILDYFSLLEMFESLGNQESLKKVIEFQGLDPNRINMELLQRQLIQRMTPLLVAVGVFDVMAYLILFRLKEWARKYVLFIAIFYVGMQWMNFSLINLVYGVGTSYYLIKNRSLFSKGWF